MERVVGVILGDIVMILGNLISNDFGHIIMFRLLLLLNRFSCIIYVLQVKFLHLFLSLDRIFSLLVCSLLVL